MPTREPSQPDDAPLREPAKDDPPGHFVSASHASDTAQFLADVQDLVRRRKEAAAERARDDSGL